MSMAQLSIEAFKRILAALDSQIFTSLPDTLCPVCHPISLRLEEILNSTDKSAYHPGARDSTDNILLATIDHAISHYHECSFCSLILRLLLRAKERHLYKAMGPTLSAEDTVIGIASIRGALKSLERATDSQTSSTANSVSSLSDDGFDIFDHEDVILQVSVEAICDYGALSLWLPLRESEDVDDNEFQLFLHPDDYTMLMADTTPNHEAVLMIPRPLNRETRDMDLMKRCLEYCRQSHEKCNNRQRPGLGTLETAPSRLIDVIDMKLVPTKPGAGMNGHVDLRQVEYVALSYVWGKDPFFTLQSSNLTSLYEINAFRDPSIKLPQTILDAIDVSQSLGYRYIWIDSLCIEQDSTHDTVTQIELMHVIYAQASLTIVAAVGDSAQHSILHIDPNQLQSRYHTVGGGTGLRFCLDRPEFKEVVASSTWATRGWTLQELTCSDRFIFFTPERTYFSCALGNWTEDLPLDESLTSEQYQRYLRDEDPKGLGLHMGTGLGREAQASAAYISMVEKLSTRNFTHDKDILKASVGMYTMYMGNSLGVAVAGLPLYYLGAALMWQPNDRLSRRRCEGGGLPSWSWASWKGPISYPLGRLEDLGLGLDDIRLTLDLLWFFEVGDASKGYWSEISPSPVPIPSCLQVTVRMATPTMTVGQQQTAFHRAPALEPPDGHDYRRDDTDTATDATSALRQRPRIVLNTPGDLWMHEHPSLAEKTVLAFEGGTICTFPVRFRDSSDHEHGLHTTSGHIHFVSIFSSSFSPEAAAAADTADNTANDSAEFIGEMIVDSGTLEHFFPDQFPTSTSAPNMGLDTSEVELLSFGRLDFSRQSVQNVLYLNRYSRRGNFSPEFLDLVDSNEDPDMVLVMWLFRHPGKPRLASRVAVGYVLRARWDEAVRERGKTKKLVRLI